MTHTYNELRKTYTEFVYKSFDIQETECEIKITFNFEITGLSSFAPTWTMPKKSDRNFKDDRSFNELVFALGMTELISYWKISCPPTVKVLCGKLDESQIRFFKKLYFSGLGEFFYKNSIQAEIDDFMDIVSLGEEFKGDFHPVSESRKALIAIGGGKDSIVSLQVLRENKDNNFCFIINPRGATLNSAYTAGYSDDRIISFNRTLDKNMLELNKKGFLNGHTPFSAIVAFSSVIAAYMNDIKYVVLSNEASANESTVKNSDVNHQYSKSFEFEKDFHKYVLLFTGSNVYYFSLLRPMSELQIAGYFSKFPKFHKVFRSCNAGSKEDKWCAGCSKCLFVSIILSPFLSTERLTEIFGKNLLDESTMEGYFSQLIGLVDEKPFECVGSIREVNTALVMTIKKLEGKGERLPFLLMKYRKSALFKEFSQRKNIYEDYYNKENLIPDYFKDLLIRECYNGKEDLK